MKRQQEFWQEEHKRSTTIPSLGKEEPADSVTWFVKYLEAKGVAASLKVVDIGCGKGRNAIYLATKGFEVYGMDYIKEALDHTKKLALKHGIANNIHLYETALDKSWPFKDNFFDLAIDCFSSIDIETAEGREIYKRELLQTLKPAGYALITVVSVNDEIEREFLKTSPGPEKNSAIWPNGKFQKDYDEAELRDFYKEFEIPKLREIKKPAFKLSRHFTTTQFWLVLRKV